MTPSLDEIRAAARRLQSRIHRTPLLSSRALSEEVGVPVFLKAENLQKCGAFKIRGVLTRIHALHPRERRAGVITMSHGNHAQAVAYAASREGIRAVVVMMEDAAPGKVAATRGYGAEVVLHGKTAPEALARVEQLRRAEGLTFLHPFDDPYMIAGHGSLALEILEDLPDAGTILVPVGGGGLLSGVACAARQARPGIRVVGTEASDTAPIRASWEAPIGDAVSGRGGGAESGSTDAGGPAPGRFRGVHTSEAIAAFADGTVLVPVEALRSASLFLLQRAKLLVESLGVTAVAALREGLWRPADRRPVVAVLSGGNEDVAALLSDGSG